MEQRDRVNCVDPRPPDQPDPSSVNPAGTHSAPDTSDVDGAGLILGYQAQPYRFEFPPETPPQIVCDVCAQIIAAAQAAALQARAAVQREREARARHRILAEKDGGRANEFFLSAGEKARAYRAAGDPDPIGRAALGCGIARETVRWWEKTANRVHAEEVKADRNRKVYQMIHDGKTNQEIADAIGVSLSTVKRLASKAYRKGRS